MGLSPVVKNTATATDEVMATRKAARTRYGRPGGAAAAALLAVTIALFASASSSCCQAQAAASSTAPPAAAAATTSPGESHRRKSTATAAFVVRPDARFASVSCGLARSSRAPVPRSRRPAGSRRLEMRQQNQRQFLSPEEEAAARDEMAPSEASSAGSSPGGEGEGEGNVDEGPGEVIKTGKFGFPELPTEFPPRRPKNYKLEKGQVGVRFINTSGDPDVCIGATPGEMVTSVAKRAGVKIATACSSGLCGTCSTDLEDKNGKSYRPGFQIVRACVTPVTILPGTDEMVLDIYRNRSSKGKLNKQLTGGEDDMDLDAETLTDAMKRFEEGWEDDFVPNYMGGSGPVDKPKNHVKKQFGKLLDPDTIKTMVSIDAQKRIENKYMYDDQPESIKRRVPNGGRDLEAKLEAARQIDLRLRLKRERRKQANYDLDLAYRPIASIEHILAMSQEDVDSRSRFFNKNPDTWEEAYGEADLPEIDREVIETEGRGSEGVTEARMAVYRSARQIPRYRFFGDPPLKEADEAYLATREDPTEEIDFDVAAELDRLDKVSGEVSNDKNSFVFRDSRTGRAVAPHKAGMPGSIRGELRSKILPSCVACQGSGFQNCLQCRAMGIAANSTGVTDIMCTKCLGKSKYPCVACSGSGVSPPWQS